MTLNSGNLKVDYEHVKCNCEKTYLLYLLDYDDIKINQMTGWIFPVKKKEHFNGIQAIW